MVSLGISCESPKNRNNSVFYQLFKSRLKGLHGFNHCLIKALQFKCLFWALQSFISCLVKQSSLLMYAPVFTYETSRSSANYLASTKTSSKAFSRSVYTSCRVFQMPSELLLHLWFHFETPCSENLPERPMSVRILASRRTCIFSFRSPKTEHYFWQGDRQ